jgi:hypothetical protein
MPARRVLWLLVFFGFAVNYMIRININIAIVGMVKHPRRRGGQGSDECLQDAMKDMQDMITPAVANLSDVLGNASFPFDNSTNVVRHPVGDDVSDSPR